MSIGKSVTFGLLLSGLFFQPGLSQSLEITSPNNVIQVNFTIKNGTPYYAVQRFGRDVISPSALGFTLKDKPALRDNFRIISEERDSVDTTWEQVWGEQQTIRNHYNELRVNLRETRSPPRELSIIFRVYDDGIGFRYAIPRQTALDSFEIMNELTEFALTGDHIAWWIPAFAGNRYEYLYTKSPVSAMDSVHTPLTMQTSDELYLSIHEAALTDYAGLTLARRGKQTLKANLIPWSDGVKVKASAPMKTPWRTIQMADTPGGLSTSRLILNLNEPNALEDVSWIQPGKYVGIWWEMHLDVSTWGSGPNHGATTENAKKYIDFAAEHGFNGVLIEGWNVGWDGDWQAHGERFDFTKPYDDFALEEVATYARDKGVYIIGHHETSGAVTHYERQMEEAFDIYQRLGVKAVKTGYVSQGRGIQRIDENGKIHYEWQHGQYMVRHYRKTLKTAAEHQIMIVAHEPIHDTGIRRTYPNMLAREGARGQEYNAWAADGGNPPEHTTILPFTRLLGGPMDFTPGIFDLHFKEARPNNRVNTTLAKQLALYVVIYSPMQMAADLPENYEARPEAFQFIKDVPADWEETKVLHGRIGDYVTVARKARNSDEWYLGSLTDENGRYLRVSLNFLPPGKEYIAEIYRDGRKSDWKTAPYDMEITEQVVDRSSALTLRLAPGGGQAIRFRPVEGE